MIGTKEIILLLFGPFSQMLMTWHHPLFPDFDPVMVLLSMNTDFQFFIGLFKSHQLTFLLKLMKLAHWFGILGIKPTLIILTPPVYRDSQGPAHVCACVCVCGLIGMQDDGFLYL